ncbi:MULTISPECIES: hypothetical protein [Flavobacteriaceae]|uniref:Lipocalin-like domain-containing protein n=2 Tax=Flavobacteriaceae TaxID=49546 RepID=A0A4Y8AX88_9FLAO|nr:MULTISPECIES: hypothetical protein [Flavobacteriaceae]TEW77156.1 hypothetical protein E2488_04725 [Gramella jeungdoensis]GGK57334.1 hypothetical protein GCM10007963_26990 [Lutibacter litoralis]
MNKNYLLVLLGITFLFSCENNPTIEGLWIVKSVTVGEEEMTPNGRWMRFNSDFTQESGNGWFQHSTGEWSLEPDNHELTVINENGLDDLNEPFKVKMSNNEMIWERMEEGLIVIVKLERIIQLPTTSGDKLLGLWKLNESVGTDNYFSTSMGTNDYLFFRWDKRFVIGTENGKVHGVYNVHGHKPEVELIPYGEQFERDFWKIDFDENTLKLKLLNTDSIVSRNFIRIHQFPQN